MPPGVRRCGLRFLIFSVTPENQGFEMSIIAQQFRAANASISKQAVAEMSWFAKNYYKPPSQVGAGFHHMLDAAPVCAFSRAFNTRVDISAVTSECAQDPAISLEPPAYLNAPRFPLLFPGAKQQEDSETVTTPASLSLHGHPSYDIPMALYPAASPSCSTECFSKQLRSKSARKDPGRIKPSVVLGPWH